MTIRETAKIDVLGERADGVVLAIVDDLDWIDPDHHERLLQDKLNAYLAFIESGQLVEHTPVRIEQASIEIRLVAVHRPNARGQDFLDRVRETLERAGYVFTVDIRE